MPGNSRLRDAIYGLAIGDALGVPYEFKARGTFLCEGMTGFGTHDQPAGTWSDDTSMALATLRSIKDNGGKVVVEDIKNNFLRWLNHGDFTTDGRLFDIGNGTFKALQTGVPGNKDYDNGNGSLMRILPLAFTDCGDDVIRKVSAITHAHKISTESCVIYVHVARRLLSGEDITKIVHTIRHDHPFERLRHIDELTDEEVSASGYVVDALEAALWSLTHVSEGGGYDEAVLKAINLGEDTDTAGAITGGLAGIIYGSGKGRWDEWFDALRAKDVIEDCLW